MKIQFERLPYEPLRITSRYGPRKTGIKGASTNHKGVDLGADRTLYTGSKDGGPVRAVLPYTVAESYYNAMRGWVVLLDHGRIEGNRIHTLYQHLKEKGLPVGKRGQAGQVIGVMGNTGVGAQLHLHFELRINGTPVDPEPYLKGVDEDMTEAEVVKIIEQSRKIYRKPGDLPEWARPAITKMIKDGHIAPGIDGSINMSEDLVRTLVILDRRLG